MRILWVKVGGLWPLTAGGRIRSFHTLRELSSRHRITVLTTHAPKEAGSELAPNLPSCAVSTVPHAPAKRGATGFAASVARSWFTALPADLWRWRVPELQRAAARALASGGFDICVADFLTALPNLPPQRAVPVVLFEHNVEHLIWRRLSRSVTAWQRPAVELEWRRLRRYERTACAAAALTVAVSEPDREALSALAPAARVRAVPTGVDTRYFAPDVHHERDRSVVFVGSMDWYPNERAALELVDVILPLIRGAEPNVQLTIVGRNPSSRLRAAAAARGVRVTGAVEDVRPHLARAAVLAVPIRVGGGTRLKIFEGLAMGKAIVSTTVGAEGLPLVPGRHFLAADDPAEFAGSVVSLMRDHGRRRKLGEAGRSLVSEHYSWQQVSRVFEARCAEVLATPSHRWQ